MTSILLANPHVLLYGGAERQIVELSNYLTQKNHKVTIMTTVACEEFKKNLKEARIYETGGNERNLMESINKVAHKFQIYNCHNHPCELMMYYNQKVPTVWQCNEPPGYVLEGNPVNPNERAYVERTCSKVMVITDFDKARFRSLYGFDPVVNYPGIRYDYFAEDVKVRNTLNMKDNFVITQAGYFTWTKQQDKTVEIFAEVKKEIRNAKLVLVGYNAWAKQYPYVAKVHKKIEELGLEDDVFVNDYLSGDENLRNIYKQTSIFLNPCLSQGAYATSFEAICAGVPTIVSNDFVASSLISDNKLGFVSSQTTGEYINKIMYIYENQNKVKDDTLANRGWIKENLTWKKFGEKYEKILEEVINK